MIEWYRYTNGASLVTSVSRFSISCVRFVVLNSNL